MAEADVVLNLEQLGVHFRTEEGLVQAVRDVSFKMERGRVLAIVGESGSGKSVTAFSILRLIQSPGSIDQGRITLFPKEADPHAAPPPKPALPVCRPLGAVDGVVRLPRVAAPSR